MTPNASNIKNLIDLELSHISDKRVVKHIRSLLIPPNPTLINWDYGEDNEQYPCWIVLEETCGNIGIAYCNEGFGPKCPWGLVFLEKNPSMGMDSGWFPTFIEAYFESAASEIPIWSVFKEDAAGYRRAITKARGWDETWKQTMILRKADASARYHVETEVKYKR